MITDWEQRQLDQIPPEKLTTRYISNDEVWRKMHECRFCGQQVKEGDEHDDPEDGCYHKACHPSAWCECPQCEQRMPEYEMGQVWCQGCEADDTLWYEQALSRGEG